MSKKYDLKKEIIRYILKFENVYVPTKHMNSWTTEEKNLLTKAYEKYDFGTILKLLPNHSRASIVNMAHKLKLTRKIYREKLKENIINNTSPMYREIEMPKRMPETKVLIKYPKQKTNMKPRADYYKKHEIDFIIKNYKTMKDIEIGEKINRTEKSVQRKRLELGLKRQNGTSYSHLQEFIRRNNYSWKYESMKQCNYSCVITGKRFDEIHHLYSLNLILNIALNELKFPIVYDINYFSDDQLKTILYKFREVQSRYPLGVCLTKELHKKFHDIYGYGNNTLEQWDNFKKQIDKEN